MITEDQVLNGTVWEAKWPLCFMVVVQWVDTSRWLLLSVPEKAAHDGTAMVAFSHGPVIKTQEEVVELLNKWEANQRPELMLVVGENIHAPL